VKGYEDVYAIGDCSFIEENPLPCTAQVAERQGIRYICSQNYVEMFDIMFKIRNALLISLLFLCNVIEIFIFAIISYLS